LGHRRARGLPPCTRRQCRAEIEHLPKIADGSLLAALANATKGQSIAL